MNILLCGKNGQLGYALAPRLTALGQVVAVDHEDFDIGNTDALCEALGEIAPDVIVNAAAYTDVDAAESDRATAFAVNSAAPGTMARWAADNGAAMIHYSTDYVFDGSGERPWREDDATNPINAYGESKLAGDEAVLASGAPCLIIRTSWLYAARGRNFLLTMLRLAAEREEIRVVDDQIGAPTAAGLIADVTRDVLVQAEGDVAAMLRERGGVVNAAAAGETSWHGFAKAIFGAARDRGQGLTVRQVEQIPSTAYPLPARRPLNSRLALAKLHDRFGITLPEWRLALEAVFDELGTKAA